MGAGAESGFDHSRNDISAANPIIAEDNVQVEGHNQEGNGNNDQYFVTKCLLYFNECSQYNQNS